MINIIQKKMNPENVPLKIFDWCEGYDAEYEFTVTIFSNSIHWHLQFDIQWSDPPKDEIQIISDYFELGPPSDFQNIRLSDEIDQYLKNIFKKYPDHDTEE